MIKNDDIVAKTKRNQIIQKIKPYYGRIIFCALFFLFFPVFGIFLAIIVYFYSITITKSILERNKIIDEKIERYNQDKVLEQKLFFVKATNYRKKDDVLEHKKDCLLIFKDEQFLIFQGDKRIENNISSIYEFRFWEYEGYDYFGIKMKSHTEYMFGVSDKVSESILIKLANKLQIKIEG